MGIDDPTDATTDFFDTHRAQCVDDAKHLRASPEAAALVAKLDEAVALCDAAIANGRRRVDQAAVIAAMPQMVTLYAGMSPKTKQDFQEARKADAQKVPRPASPPIDEK